MIDFGLQLDLPTTPVVPVVPVHTVEQDLSVAAVEQDVVVTRSTPARTSYLTRDDAQWDWSQLRDYVLHEIEQRHGPQVRDPKREAGIFKSFLARWPDGEAAAIARVAFGPVYNGMWRGAPITATRFCKASDVYFAQVIAARL